VPEEMLELIFTPFFRVDRSREQDGFGLGLALAKRQIESMGGEIQAKNRASGGLNMQVTFPIHHEEHQYHDSNTLASNITSQCGHTT